MHGLKGVGITVRFGGIVAVDDVSISAPHGSVTGLIGPNGAGKTTLFNVCCGFQRPQRGRVYLGERDVTRSGPVTRARAGLGRTFQIMELFTSLTVEENVALAVESSSVTANPLTVLLPAFGRSSREVKAAKVAELLELVGLSGQAHLPASALPTGQRRLLELARCLARDPRMLLLDEPSSGLDPRETSRFGELVRSLTVERAMGVLLIEHDMGLVLSICERIVVLDFGRLLFEGTPSEVRSSPEVQAAYLGEQAAA
jgi:ABC-type branched-subunit amino acid transport system ATPase component